MRVAIIGYGKMGREIESQAKEQHIEISRILDINDKIEEINFESDEVAIEFSMPDSAPKNIIALAKKRVPVICGTTGWISDSLDDVANHINENSSALLYASNFSIGVHLFWSVVEHASKLINKFPDYDIFGHEFHHSMKKDSPSGTALTTGEVILKEVDRKKRLQAETLLDRAINPEELHFTSTRGGGIFGTHSVYLDSPVDSIEIVHQAKSRSGFAKGALECSKWVQNKKGIFTIEDYIREVLHD